MANSVEQRPAKTTDNNANQTSHYVTLAIAVVLGLVGTFLRFVQDSFMMSTISNIILALAWLIVFRIVFKIMK